MDYFIRPWLKDFKWDIVVELNRQRCEQSNALHKPTSDGYQTAKKTWEGSCQKIQDFREAVELCRECHRLAPFCNFNGNTFAEIAKVTGRDIYLRLNRALAKQFQSAVGHYVVGVLGEDEFRTIYNTVRATVI